MPFVDLGSFHLLQAKFLDLILPTTGVMIGRVVRFPRHSAGECVDLVNEINPSRCSHCCPLAEPRSLPFLVSSRWPDEICHRKMGWSVKETGCGKRTTWPAEWRALARWRLTQM
jgi:hypothetical protein